jgi:phosphatidylglycerophosphate synthase
MINNRNWKTKPSDRFVLKWIKLYLSAPVTPRLARWGVIAPWHITLSSALLGCAAGWVFAYGIGWLAGMIAAVAQLLDGVDGQLARLTDRQTKGGAFWDSVLDRYADGAMVIGMIVYLLRLSFPIPPAVIITSGAFAFIGSNLVSYSSARAGELGIDLGQKTLVSKGTRSAAMIVAALGSIIWPALPMIALVYLMLHTNLAVIRMLIKTHHNKEAFEQ